MLWFLWLLINTVVQPPQHLVLHNQQIIVVTGSLQINGPMVRFGAGKGQRLCLRISRVDWWQTLQPKPLPEQPAQVFTRDRHAIDWNHPAMRHKQRSLRSIAIDDLGLREFMRGQKRRTAADPERGPRGASAAEDKH